MLKKLWDLVDEQDVIISEQKPGTYKYSHELGIQKGIIKSIRAIQSKNEVLDFKIEPASTEEVGAAFLNFAEVIKNEYVEPEVVKEPVKKLVAYCCEECGHIGVIFTDTEQPHLCSKCETYHHFGDLVPTSYFCECGAKYKFLQEDDVDKIKCRGCGHMHHMIFDTEEGCYKSVDDIRYTEGK